MVIHYSEAFRTSAHVCKDETRFRGFTFLKRYATITNVLTVTDVTFQIFVVNIFSRFFTIIIQFRYALLLS